MDVPTAALALFGLLELMNVGVLYFAPGSRKANGVGVFTAWEKSKADPQVHEFVRYLVSWVAGTKAIFLGLLAVVLITATEQSGAVREWERTPAGSPDSDPSRGAAVPRAHLAQHPPTT